MSYFDTKDPVPEGHTLLRGHMLSVAARSAKITFRLAYRARKPGEGCHDIPDGLLIRTEDLPAMKEALDRREERKIREKKFCNPATRS